MSRFELPTFSLPRKRSTPELHRLKRARDRVRTGDIQLADALPTELLSLIYTLKSVLINITNIIIFLMMLMSGESRIRTCEVKKQQIYSLSSLAA